jgi:hypothetical protein
VGGLVDIIRRAIMVVKDWLNVEFLKLLSRHFSGAVAINLFFGAAAWISKHTLEDKTTLIIVEQVDYIVIIASVIWLAVIMLLELVLIFWLVVKGGGSGSANSILVA